MDSYQSKFMIDMKVESMLFNNTLIEYTKKCAATDIQFISVIEDILKNIEALVTKQKSIPLKQITINENYIGIQRTFLCLLCGVQVGKTYDSFQGHISTESHIRKERRSKLQIHTSFVSNSFELAEKTDSNVSLVSSKSSIVAKANSVSNSFELAKTTDSNVSLVNSNSSIVAKASTPQTNKPIIVQQRSSVTNPAIPSSVRSVSTTTSNNTETSQPESIDNPDQIDSWLESNVNGLNANRFYMPNPKNMIGFAQPYKRTNQLNSSQNTQFEKTILNPSIPQELLKFISKRPVAGLAQPNNRNNELVLNSSQNAQFENTKMDSSIAQEPPFLDKTKINNPTTPRANISSDNSKAESLGKIIANQFSQQCYKNIEQILHNMFSLKFPDMKFTCIGSRIQNLNHTKSDLNIYVQTGIYREEYNTQKIKTILNWFTLHSNDWIDPQIVTVMKKYTIIRVKFNKHSLHCSLVFDAFQFLCSSKWIDYMIGLYPKYHQFILEIRKWFVENNLYSLLRGYVINLLAIYYLQLQGLLPSVHEIQKNIPNKEDCLYNGSFIEIPHNILLDNKIVTSENNLFKLLKGFYKLYSGKLMFQFAHHVVSVQHGDLLDRNCFNIKNKTLPRTMRRLEYCRKTSVEYRLTNQYTIFSSPAPMCVQDPFDLNANVAGHVNDEMVKLFVSACSSTYKKLLK